MGNQTDDDITSPKGQANRSRHKTDQSERLTNAANLQRHIKPAIHHEKPSHTTNRLTADQASHKNAADAANYAAQHH